MPTYRNDSTNRTIIVEGLNGIGVALKPGESSQTYRYYSDTDLAKTAETPRYNPVLDVQSVTGNATTDDEIDIDENTKAVNIVNASGQLVTAYLGVKANTPGIPIADKSDIILKREDFGRRIQKLVFTFGGAVASGCTVIQSGE